MFGMAANCAGIVGGQLFRSDDLPYYHRGWTIIICFLSLGLGLVIFSIVQYGFTNKIRGGAVIKKADCLEDSQGSEGAPIIQKYNY